MPAFLQPNLRFSPKSSSLTILFIFAPLLFFGQTLTGLWVGSISNDSNTVRKDQSFEIALTEYRGKVYGYSRSEFIVNDSLFYIMKRVKGTIDGNTCEVVDDEIISYNFPGKLDKGVKVISTFQRNLSDSTWYLDGTWKTKKTKNFYSITGKVALAEEKDLSASKIFPHLEELNLADKVAFYQERKEENTPVLKLVKPATALTRTAAIPIVTGAASPATQVVSVKPEMKRAEAEEVSVQSITKKQSEEQGTKTSSTITETAKAADKKNEKQVLIEQKKEAVVQQQQKPALSNQLPATITPVQASTTVDSKKENPETTNIPAIEKQEQTVTAGTEKKESLAAKPRQDLLQQAAVVKGRKSEFTQEVMFKSDSLVLSLFDNGEIDGDTVTIYMNAEIIMAKQGLKASAIKKTIYLKPGENDEFTLVLFADNLGKYPPNTGLLVIKDGNDIYNLRFSADFQKNAGIIFKRKK